MNQSCSWNRFQTIKRLIQANIFKTIPYNFDTWFEFSASAGICQIFTPVFCCRVLLFFVISFCIDVVFFFAMSHMSVDFWLTSLFIRFQHHEKKCITSLNWNRKNNGELLFAATEVQIYTIDEIMQLFISIKTFLTILDLQSPNLLTTFTVKCE